MSAVRSTRAAPSERACLQCQRRKTRCLPADDLDSPCVFCAKAGKTCVFPDKPNRTPLTRKNLDDAEERVRTLEVMLQLDGGPQTLPSHRSQSQDQMDQSAQSAQEREEPPGSPQRIGPGGEPTPYEWNETSTICGDEQSAHVDKAADGMPSMPDADERSGYLGNSSGYSLLKSVSSLLPPEIAASQGHWRQRGRTASEVQRAVPLGEPLWSYQLSATVVQEHLISAYFRCYNPLYPVLRERIFREKCALRSKIPRDASWHIIYYMVLAIGEWLSGYCGDEHSLYYDAARSRFRVEHLESGNANNVQAFLLIGNYLQKRDRPNTGYNYIGIAYRMALGLGLHREPAAAAASIQNSLAMHRRRVLFWTLYSFDSGFSITTGRPLLVSDSFIDVKNPLNIDDSLPIAKGVVPQEAGYPTTYSALIAQARLARIANKIYAQFMSVLSCADVDQQSSIMEQMLQNWKASLPAYFFSADVPDWFLGPRQIVLWKQANLNLLLLLASQRHHADVHDKLASGRRYRKLAADIIVDISEFCIKYPTIHHAISWYAIYFLLHACLALSVHEVGAAASVTQAERDEGFRVYEEMSARAHACLETLALRSKAATRSLELLSRLRDNVRHSAASPNMQLSGAMRRPTPLQLFQYPTGTPPANDAGSASQLPMPTAINPGNVGEQGFTPTVDNIMMDWGMAAADPSLSMFFGGTDNVNDLFQGVDGFPGTMELENFAYQTSNWPLG